MIRRLCRPRPLWAYRPYVRALVDLMQRDPRWQNEAYSVGAIWFAFGSDGLPGEGDQIWRAELAFDHATYGAGVDMKHYPKVRARAWGVAQRIAAARCVVAREKEGGGA